MKLPFLMTLLSLITLACTPPPQDSSSSKGLPEQSVAPLARKSFANPIMKSGADPWVVQKDGWYYNCYAAGDSIKVRKTSILSDIESSPAKPIWKAPEGKPYSKEIWAPELHFVQGKWYVYFAADDGKNSNHRMYVLESETDDAMGNYVFKGVLQTQFWAIDGTVLEVGKQLYFIWSGWDAIAKKQQSLYIAPMKNPWTLADGATFRQKIEAEKAEIKRASVRKTAGASAGQVVGKIDYADSSVTFRVKAPKAGDYALDITYGNGSGKRSTQNLIVNDAQKQAVIFPSMGWENRQTVTAKIKLKAGDNTLRFTKGDNFAELDFITVKDYGRDPVLISMPEYQWERRGGPDYVNEGPEILRNGKKTMIIYSASGSWTNDYALGQLTLVGGEDVMNSQAWQKVGAVFQSSNEVYGPGHASFVKTVDGKEDWIVYHAAKMKGSKWSRNVRIQPFTWKADGSPDFGQPKRIDESQSFPYQE